MIRLPTSDEWLQRAATSEDHSHIGAGPPEPCFAPQIHFTSRAEPKSGMPAVFLCYSQSDLEIKRRLQIHLQSLQDLGQVSLIEETWIDSGDSWFFGIRNALRNAPVALMVVDQAFLESPFVQREEIAFLIEEAAQNGTFLVPITLDNSPPTAFAWDFHRFEPVLRHLETAGQDNAAEVLIRLRSYDRSECSKMNDAVVKHPDSIDVCFERFYPLSNMLFGRRRELQLLDDCWHNAQVRVISFLGTGGSGKSSLVAHWLSQLQRDHFRGAEKVFTWSFYSQGGGNRVHSGEHFVREALLFFGDSANRSDSAWLTGRRLADRAVRGKNLIVIDGLEPIQERGTRNRGHIIDPAVLAFLTRFSEQGLGLCVLTSREPIRDLEHCGSAQMHGLDQLSSDAGRALLRCAGVRGFDKELEGVSEAFGHNALALTLLGSFLTDEPGHRAAFASSLPELNDHRRHPNRHAFRVLAGLSRRFAETAEIEVLRLLSLFDRPAAMEEISALLAGPRLPGINSVSRNSQNGFNAALKRVINLRLVTQTNLGGRSFVDSHPLIREYFAKDIRQNFNDAWVQGHRCLATFLEHSVPTCPTSLDKILPLYSAVAHRCLAGDHQLAFREVYWPRIHRKEKRYATTHLGIIATDIAVLKLFFQKEWSLLVPGLEFEVAWSVLQMAGWQLWHLGRLEDASEAFNSAFALASARGHPTYATKSARRLAEVLHYLGDLSRAKAVAVDAVSWADSCEGIEKVRAQVDSRITLANIYNQSGIFDVATGLLNQAEELRLKFPSESYLGHIWGFWYCDLFLESGRTSQLLKRALRSLRQQVSLNDDTDIVTHGTLLSKALQSVCVAMVRQTFSPERHHPCRRIESLDRSVEMLRATGQIPHLAKGLLVRAIELRESGRTRDALRDLLELRQLTKSSRMRLLEVDFHLESARLCLAKGRVKDAHQEAVSAGRVIRWTGYKRRLKELKAIMDLIKSSGAVTDGRPNS